MIELYKQSKIVISAWGIGRKCFRDAEAPFDSVMAIQETYYHYSYPWIDGKNCIKLPNKISENGLEQIDEEAAVDIILYYLNRLEKGE
jgi:hypothetical protein